MANTKVQSEQIEDGSITADKLADGTIVAAELANNAVVTAAINADAVTGAKIADDAIDSEHYTDGSIDTAHIADAQITVAKMAANSVDSDQYVDGSIDTVHLGDLQVTTAKIANGNISTAKIADNAVTSAKIDTNIDIAGTFDVTGATTLDSTLAVNLATPFGQAQISDTDWSSGAPYGTVLTVTGNNTNDANWGHLMISDSSTGTGNGGMIRFATGSTSSDMNPFAGIDSFTEGSAYGGLKFLTRPNGGTATARMTILSDGKVGIGTDDPAQKLEVAGRIRATTDPTFEAYEASGKRGGLQWDSTNDFLKIFSVGGDIVFESQNNSGNVGIGTTSPSYKLTINSADEDHIRLENGSELGFIRLMDTGILDFWAHGTDEITFTNGTGTGTERVRIDSSGNVGIGTTSPTSGAGWDKFVNISGGTSNAFVLDGTDSQQAGVGAVDGLYIDCVGHTTSSNNKIIFRTASSNSSYSGTERMRIDSSGNVGMGIVSQSGVKLYVDAPSSTHAGVFRVDSGAYASIICDNQASSGTRFFTSFRIDNSIVGNITSTGSSTTYATSSDYRLKENIQPLENGLKRLNQLKPVKFNWIEDGKEEEGFIAHEVSEIFSDAVVGEKDAVNEDGSIDGQTMDYGRITPLLVKAIQEQQEQIETLKKEVEELKGG